MKPHLLAVRLAKAIPELAGLPLDWTILGPLKAAMNKRGWWMSLRDAGDGSRVDCCWFWARNWRRTGMGRGGQGEEPIVVVNAALNALESAVPEEVV